MVRISLGLSLVIWASSPTVSLGFEEPPKAPAGGGEGQDRAADWPTDPAALLKRLKDRDADFDNRSLKTEQRWLERVSPSGQIAAAQFDARRFGRPNPGSPPEGEIPKDFDQPHRLRRLLTVREPAITIERLEDAETMKHPEYVAIPNRGARWSSAGGVERVWSPETNQLHIEGAPSSDGLLRWDANMLEWTCGYGLSKWIESIDSVRVGDDRLIVKGRMRLMGYDDSRVEVQLDRTLIIRRAVVSVPVKDGGGTNEFRVETRGTARPEGCPPVAQSGRFRRILKPTGKPESVYQDFEVRFIAASDRLTDEQYAERTRIEPGPKTVTIDSRRRN